MKHRPARRRRGFMFIDAVIALGLLTSVAMLLVVARSGMTRVTRQADDHRAAVRIAENYLVKASLASSASSTPAVSDEATAQATTRPTPQLSIADLATPAPAGWKWVSVRVTVNGRVSELVGLVRRGT